MAKRTREIVIRFSVTPEELEAIQQKMEQLGTTNREAYLRKMAIDGYVISLDIPELKELLRLMRYTSNNVNQIAHHTNATGIILSSEVSGMKNSFDELREAIKKLLLKLGNIS